VAATHRAQVARIAVAVVALAAAVCGDASVNRALAGVGQQRLATAALAAPLAGRSAAESRHPAAQVARLTPATEDRTLLDLPAAVSPDGSAVDVGYPDAPATLTLLEDYRCSTTGTFERTQGPTLARLTADHQVLVRYVLESSLDERLPGPGALLATNAARSALAHGRFPLYHALLFANQPPEHTDGFTTDRLLGIASTVPGLRGPAFDSEVRGVRYRDWVAQAQGAYDRLHSPFGTPTLLIDGQLLDTGAHPELLAQPSALESIVRSAAHRG
jgi:protein-disulfide isomerase